jgi:hypothetical protein
MCILLLITLGVTYTCESAFSIWLQHMELTQWQKIAFISPTHLMSLTFQYGLEKQNSTSHSNKLKFFKNFIFWFLIAVYLIDFVL